MSASRDDASDPSLTASAPGAKLGTRVVLLTNFVPPYRLPVFEALAGRVSNLTILASTEVEADRSWAFETGRLDVRVQRTLSLQRRWRHPAGFADSTALHIPWDTLFRLRDLRPDVIVSGELGARTIACVLYRARYRACRLVVWATLSERTEVGRGRARRVLRRWLLARVDRVIVNGASGERYVRSLGFPPDRIDRIPQVALPEFAEVGLNRPLAPVRSLLFVGQLIERKGLVSFLHALDGWARSHPTREIVITVAGSGPLREMIERVRPGGRLKVEVLGHRDPRALPELYGRADALVLPTLADEWGLVVNEALAAGLPVLGSVHSQAVEDLIEDSKTGWVFDPEDSESTRSAIERTLATAPEELAAMRKRSRYRVRGLTPGWAADRIVASLRAALGHPRR